MSHNVNINTYVFLVVEITPNDTLTYEVTSSCSSIHLFNSIYLFKQEVSILSTNQVDWFRFRLQHGV